MNPLIFLFLLLASSSFAQNSSINPISSQTFPSYPPTWSGDGFYYYYSDGITAISNVSTGQWWQIEQLIPQCTGNGIIATSYNEFFCDTALSSNIGSFVWYQFSPENFTVFNKTQYTFGKNSAFYTQSDNYITFVQEKIGLKGYNVTVYNTFTTEYSCSLQDNVQHAPIYIDYIGNGYLYPSPNFNKTAYFYPCSGDSPISSNLSTLEIMYGTGFTNMNQSTVFLGGGTNNKGQHFSQASFLDLTGSLHAGPIYQYAYSRFNDTHFVAVFAQNGTWNVGAFVVGPTLNFVLVKQLDLQILSSYEALLSSVQAIQGGNFEIYVGFTSSSGFIYDMDQNIYTNTYSDFTPFQLANGSWVNMTMFGYFIQSPGEPIYFNQAYYQSVYIDPEFENVYTLYIPNQLNKQFGYNECVLYQYSINSSSISHFMFKSCPQIDVELQIGDVSFDFNGDPVVTVFYGTVYVITSSGFKQISTGGGGENMAVSMNFSTDLGIVAYPTYTNFTISHFFISNGSIINTTTVPFTYKQEYIGYTVQKLTSQYYLLSNCNLTNSIFIMWDTYNQVSIYQKVLNQSYIILERSEFEYRVYQFPAVGILSKNSSTIIEALVWGNIESFFVDNLSGTVISQSLPSEEVMVISSTGYGNFWMESINGMATIWRYYEL